MNNVTDLSGNQINQNQNNANYFLNPGDITPPVLLSANVIDSVNIELVFSEALDSLSARNKYNYSISENVIVLNANQNVNLNKVILSTTPHTSGHSYTVTVSNVKDLNNNLISPQSNYAIYNYYIDMTPPEITGIVITNTKSVTINYSEKVDPIKAKTKSNYFISNNISISSVILQPDSMSVILKTTTQERNKDYTLRISNITDRNGNTVAPNPKTLYYRLPKKGSGYLIQTPILSAISNSWNQNYMPENTIDGDGMNNPDSRWMSNSTMPDTICYDLGTNTFIDSMRISFYKWDSNRRYKYSVLGSRDSINWDEMIPPIWSDSSEWSETEFDSTNARFVKLILHESNQSPWASIWEVELFGPSSTTALQEEISTPGNYVLEQNYPNPFNPATIITYSIPQKSHVSLKVYDMLGQQVSELINQEIEPGKHSVSFNAAELSSGIYLYTLETSVYKQTNKMLLLK